jgi:multicomponent Na+:H+ antiporter subunit D
VGAVGGADDDSGEDEMARPPRRPAIVMVAAPLVLLAVSLGLGLAPGMAQAGDNAAAGFANRGAYAVAVLDSKRVAVAHPPASPITLPDVLIDLGEAAGALALAGVALARRRWADRLRQGAVAATAWLRHQHSGHVGDQVTWLVVGLAVLAGLSGLALR